MSKISDLHETLVGLEVAPISKSCHYSSQDRVNILKTVNEFNRPLANEMAENPSQELFPKISSDCFVSSVALLIAAGVPMTEETLLIPTKVKKA